MTSCQHEHGAAVLETIDHVRHRLADPDHGECRLHDLADRPLEHRGSWNAFSMSGSSLIVPEISFAASGCSVVVATTSCDTPSWRMVATVSRAICSGVTTTSSAIRASFVATTSPAVVPGIWRNRPHGTALVPRCRRRTRGRLRRRVRHVRPGSRARPGRLRRPGARGLQRDALPHPARRHPDMHAAFFDVGVDVVETASFGSFSVVLNEYGIADKAHELNVAAGAPRPRGGRRATPPTGARGTSPARSVPAPSCRASATSASPPCATPTRSRRPACSRAASTCS